MVQFGVPGHEALDARQIIRVDRLFQLSDLTECINVGLELWPARETIEAGSLELRVRD